MRKIPDKTLERMLEVYKPSCRYLVGAKSNYPKGEGIFKIPSSYYLKDNSGHFNAIETIMCYNQLAYTFFTDSLKKGLIPETGKITSKEFKEKYQLKNSFILKMDNVKFREMIDLENFKGEIRLNRIISRDNLIYFKTSYDFEKGKATGDIDLGFVRE